MNAVNSCRTVLILITLGMVGCGDKDISAIAAKHNRICETEMNATNCPEGVDVSGLIMFCKLVSTSFLDTEACNTKMDAYVACNAERSWACLEGGEIPVPVQPDACPADVTAPFTLPSGECVDETKVSSSQ